MTVPDSQCNAKVLRLERCVVFDSTPCAACIEDIELEKEIEELEHSIEKEKLQTRRRALRTVMNENHDHLIHKFPPEIASRIFIQYAPPSVSRDKKERSTPLRLGAVCRRWRQLAWATPQLWSSLVVEVKALGEHPLQLIAEWLKRSGSLPLTIRFNHPSAKQVRGVYPAVTNILNKHSARWYDMYLDIPADHLHHLCGSSQGNILRRLTLRHSILNPTRSKFSTFSMTSKPRPTDLTLLSVGLPCVNITWNNLTVASLYDIGVDECVELIRRAPLLQTLRLQEINTSSGGFPTPNKRIVHPHLHSLELWGVRKKSVVFGILDSLCLPSLEQWLHHDCPLLLKTMISFIGYLSCLKIFKINIDYFDCDQVIKLLSHLSSLESLELRSTYPVNYMLGEINPIEELLDLLVNPTQSSLFLPRLQSLEFACRSSFPWKFLPQIFASSRWRSLRVKVYTCRRDVVDKTAKLVPELVDKGFDFSIGEIGASQEYEDWGY
jgi:hypothetical protein